MPEPARAQHAAPAPAPVPTPAPAPASSATTPGALSRQSGVGRPLPAAVRAPIERSLRADLSDVRVHDSPQARATVDAVPARALTYGPNILLGSGERPNDLALLAHESAHVLQQRGGGPAPMAWSDGAGGDAFEGEAQGVAAAVLAGKPATVQLRARPRPMFGLWGRIVSGARAAVSAVADVAGNVIERVVNFLRERARSIPGYDLLAVIIGRDPITRQPVERNAVNLLRGLLGLIPGGAAIFENLQQARVIERAFAWVGGELTRLGLTWENISGAVRRFLDSLGAGDLLNLGGVFERARNLFGPIVRGAISFATAAGEKVLEFIFEGAIALGGSAAQQVLGVIRRIGATVRLIIRDPIRFIGNLVNAILGGFRNFGRNILGHLRTAIFDWLFGALQGGGIQLPQRFDMRGILSIVLQVLGLTYQRMRERLVRLIGEPAVRALEVGFEFLRVLVTEGIAAAWQKILEYAQGMADTVIEMIKSWVRDTIVGQAIQQIASLITPAGAIIQACIKIYQTVMFVIERARQIMAFVESVIDSISAIAQGNIGAAVAAVERTLARILPLVISFLARLIGLGGISQRIRQVIQRIQASVDRAIDRVLQWVRQAAGAVVGAGRAAVGAAREAVGSIIQWWRKRTRVGSGSEQHTLYFRGSEDDADLYIESTPRLVANFVDDLRARPEYQSGAKRTALNAVDTKVTEIRRLRGEMRQARARGHVNVAATKAQEISNAFDAIGLRLGQVFATDSYGTESDPIEIDWFGPPTSAYPPLYLGGRLPANRRPKRQANLKAIYTLNRVDETGHRVLKYEAERPATPPDGERIGISARFRISVGKKLGPLSQETTAGGSKLANIIIPYGYNATEDGFQLDHVHEIQFGGLAQNDKVENLWPLEAAKNSAKGSSLANARIEFPRGVQTRISVLKLMRNRQFWFKVKSVRS